MVGGRLPRYARNDVYGARNDVYGARSDVYGARNDVYGARNDVYGARNDVLGTINDGGYFFRKSAMTPSASAFAVARSSFTRT